MDDSITFAAKPRFPPIDVSPSSPDNVDNESQWDNIRSPAMDVKEDSPVILDIA